MSGLDPSLLGGPSLYQGAGRFREPATGLPAEASDEPADADDAAAADAPRPLAATGAPRAGSSARGGRRSRTAPPMTIAERRRAERRRQEEDQ